jgi:RNA polymerase sigma-70 factor (ECF subfamily)
MDTKLGMAFGGALRVLDYAGLVQACARGDRQALRSLYDEEAARLVAVAQRIVRRRELAEEVVQDAFVQVWQKAATFDASVGSARAWIYTIVRHRALNVIRDGAREDLLEAEELAAVQDRASVVEDAFSQLTTESRLRACLEELDREKRESLLLSYVAGYSHGEIAGLMRVPIGTAKSWVRRALMALKDCMA